MVVFFRSDDSLIASTLFVLRHAWLPAAVPEVPLSALLALIVLYAGLVFLFPQEFSFDLRALFVRVSHLAFARFLVALASPLFFVS